MSKETHRGKVDEERLKSLGLNYRSYGLAVPENLRDITNSYLSLRKEIGMRIDKNQYDIDPRSVDNFVRVVVTALERVSAPELKSDLRLIVNDASSKSSSHAKISGDEFNDRERKTIKSLIIYSDVRLIRLCQQYFGNN